MTETLNWGILSTARINRKVIPAIRAVKGATAFAVASRSEEQATEYASEDDIPKAFGSYEALLADPKVDCVYIPLPNSLHAEWTIKALEAGKHVLCEKPLASDAQEAEKIADAAKRTELVCFEAFMYRFHPQWERTRTLIDTGEIGDLKAMHASFGFALDDTSNVRLRGELAGGSLMDVGCYCINAARQVSRAEPIGVCATAFYHEETGVDNAMAGTLEFPNRFLVTFDCGFTAAYRHTATIIGTEGTIHLSHPWTPGPDEETTLTLTRAEGEETYVIPSADEYALEVEHFCNVVRGEEPELRWGIDDGVRQMRVLDALRESAKKKAPVSLG